MEVAIIEPLPSGWVVSASMNFRLRRYLVDVLACDLLVIGKRILGSWCFDVTTVVRHWQFISHLIADVTAGHFRDLVTFNLVLDSHQAFKQRFRAWRTTRNVDVHGNNEIDTLYNVIAPFEIRTTANCARAHCDHELWVGH